MLSLRQPILEPTPPCNPLSPLAPPVLPPYTPYTPLHPSTPAHPPLYPYTPPLHHPYTPRSPPCTSYIPLTIKSYEVYQYCDMYILRCRLTRSCHPVQVQLFCDTAGRAPKGWSLQAHVTERPLGSYPKATARQSTVPKHKENSYLSQNMALKYKSNMQVKSLLAADAHARVSSQFAPQPRLR